MMDLANLCPLQSSLQLNYKYYLSPTSSRCIVFSWVGLLVLYFHLAKKVAIIHSLLIWNCLSSLLSIMVLKKAPFDMPRPYFLWSTSTQETISWAFCCWWFARMITSASCLLCWYLEKINSRNKICTTVAQIWIQNYYIFTKKTPILHCYNISQFYCISY